MKTFSSRRTELQTVISGYVAIGMSSANDSLARVEKKLNAQFDIITNIFRKLDTQTEISFFRFVRDNGGETACVNDDHLLPKLLKAAGEDIKPGDLYNLKIKEELQNALRENLNEVLDKNYLRFEKMIQVENNNFRNTLNRLSAHLDLQHDLAYDNKLKLDKIEETVTMMLRLGKMESVTDKIEDPVRLLIASALFVYLRPELLSHRNFIGCGLRWLAIFLIRVINPHPLAASTR